MENYTPLSQIVVELDIAKGEIIYLASDITRLANTARKHNERFDPLEFLKFFTDAIGEEGTLLLPAFNYNLRKNAEFDIINTPPITGILPQYALKAPGFMRTYNALHSFAVWGKHAEELSKLENESSFSEESPFGFLFHHKARMIAIDLDLQASLTFAHYTEEQERVKYRSWKKINVRYTNAERVTEKKVFKLFAKKPGYVNDVNPIEQPLMEAGALIQKTINGINFMSVDLAKTNEVIKNDIRNNKAKNIVHFDTKQWAKSMVKSAIGKK